MHILNINRIKPEIKVIDLGSALTVPTGLNTKDFFFYWLSQASGSNFYLPEFSLTPPENRLKLFLDKKNNNFSSGA